MSGEAPARHHVVPPMVLPCDAFLDAPNEVAAPDFGLFRDTLTSHFYPARVEALDRDADMRDPWLSAIHLTLTTSAMSASGQRPASTPATCRRITSTSCSAEPSPPDAETSKRSRPPGWPPFSVPAGTPSPTAQSPTSPTTGASPTSAASPRLPRPLRRIPHRHP